MARANQASSGLPASGWQAATWSLRYPKFRWIFASNLLFFFAMNGQFIVRSYLAYKLTNDNAAALGLINLVVAVPMLVMSPIGGVVADRVDRRKLILLGQALVVANELFVFGMLAGGALEFWHLLASVFMMGAIFPFIMPARQAIVANIVGREGLGNAMALTMGGMNASRIAGPALAGFLIATVDVKATYLVAVLLYAAAMLSMWKAGAGDQRSEPRERKSVLGDLTGGFSFVAKHPGVRSLMLISMVPVLFAQPFQALLVVFAEDVWDAGSGGLGILQAAAGIGGILGSVWVAWRGNPRSPSRLMLTNLLLFGGTLFLFAVSPWFALGIAMVIVADIFANVFQTTNGTAMQLLIPDEVRGRVMSLGMMTFGLTPLGTLPVSAAAEVWGAPAAVAGSAVAMIAVTALAWYLSPSLRGIDRVIAAENGRFGRTTQADRPVELRGGRPAPSQG
jgi:predicted MFS family arabinose efflux permease